MQKNNRITFALLALTLVVSAALSTVSLAQAKQPRPDVWTLLETPAQDIALTRTLKSGVTVKYSKPALDLMKTFGVQEGTGYEYLYLNNVKTPGVEKKIEFAGEYTEVYIVKLGVKTSVGTVPELRVVFYTADSYSQTRIFDLGAAYADVPQPKKGIFDKGKDTLKGGWNRIPRPGKKP